MSAEKNHGRSLGRIDGWCNYRKVIRNVESAKRLQSSTFWQSHRCSRTEPGTCALDNAFALIEGHLAGAYIYTLAEDS